MHEWSVAESILDAIEQSLGRKRDILAVNLRLGPLSGISAGSLSFSFEEIAKAKGFGAPELCITEIPARLRCADCSREYQAGNLFELCPGCGSLRREILSGQELLLDSVEVAEEAG